VVRSGPPPRHSRESGNPRLQQEVPGELKPEVRQEGFQKFLLVTVAVTFSRRTPAIVMGQRGAPDTSKGVRMTVGSTAGKPGIRIVSRFAYAAEASAE
jgi:hypothetical protein